MKPSQENKEARTRRLRARNKSGTITYIVQTAKEEQKQQILGVASSQAGKEQANVQVRIDQEKVVAMLENISASAKEIDYRVLDELNSLESEQAASLKAVLNSLEMLAQHWGMIKKERYEHRVADHAHLDIYINEIPRATSEGKFFNIKTFILSCKTPYMKTKDGTKVFISKEYSNAAGKLHLGFNQIHNLITRELNTKLETISRDNSRKSIMAFFKTMFSSSSDGIFHPLFKETVLLKKFKKQLKIFELCIRNFEITYIAMIKELQDKTFKMNLDVPFEKSIIMKKREKQTRKSKVIDNQIFDADGILLSSMKNSFNHSILGSQNSRIQSDFTQSIAGNYPQLNCAGPQATPMNHLRKMGCDDHINKPTSSSQGPSRIKQSISPTSSNNRANLSRSSRNSGFRPIQSAQHNDSQSQGVFKRKPEYVGSLISSGSSQTRLGNIQAMINVQKKTISPLVIKHNYMPLQLSQTRQNSAQHPQNISNSNDDLIVKYVDLNDDKENFFASQNIPLKASINNFAFQTPNPYQQTAPLNNLKLLGTQGSGNSSNTPGYNASTLAGTIIHNRTTLSSQQDCPQSTNAFKTKFQGSGGAEYYIDAQEEQNMGGSSNFAECKAQYKNMVINNKRVIKTSRNLFNTEANQEAVINVNTKDPQRGSFYHEDKTGGLHKHSGSNDVSGGFQQQAYIDQQFRIQGENAKSKNNNFVTDNSFDHSSDGSSNGEQDSDDNSCDDRHDIHQSSMMRASRIESRLDQINQQDLQAYNNLIDQFTR